jgi:RNA polymerase sigma factor (sigma-70 family)
MRDDPQVTDLVIRASRGDRQAWDALVERYAPLIWAICRRYRLVGTDAEDVSQAVWLTMVEQLGNLRDPAALPGWLVTTTRRECGRVQRATAKLAGGGQVLENLPDAQAIMAEKELLTAERHAALREAFARLPSASQQLLALLIADPPLPYAEISVRLGIPIGSIGPNRSRCLDKLRRDPAIARLIGAEPAASRNPYGPRRRRAPGHTRQAASARPVEHARLER